MAHGIRLSALRREIARTRVEYPREKLVRVWQSSPARRMQIETLDRDTYVAVPRQIWDRVFQHLGIHKFSYESDIADCDDFAFAARGRAPLELRVNGIAAVLDWSGAHAYCAVLVAGRVPAVLFVEIQAPTPGTWWVENPGADNSMYDMERGRALF